MRMYRASCLNYPGYQWFLANHKKEAIKKAQRIFALDYRIEPINLSVEHISKDNYE